MWWLAPDQIRAFTDDEVVAKVVGEGCVVHGVDGGADIIGGHIRANEVEAG